MKANGVNKTYMNELMKVTGKVFFELHNTITGCTKYYVYTNLITTAGKTAVARRLRNAASLANEGVITYGAVGTNATAPALADVKLGTELARAVLSSTSNVTGVVTLRVYFGTTEANGALKEFGLFGEAATAVADTGTLYNHVNIDITKTAADTLTIQAVITIA